MGPHFRLKLEKSFILVACETNNHLFIIAIIAAIYGGLTVCQMYKLLYLYHLYLGDQ